VPFVSLLDDHECEIRPGLRRERRQTCLPIPSTLGHRCLKNLKRHGEISEAVLPSKASGVDACVRKSVEKRFEEYLGDAFEGPRHHHDSSTLLGREGLAVERPVLLDAPASVEIGVASSDIKYVSWLREPDVASRVVSRSNVEQARGSEPSTPAQIDRRLG
jgi:hypothetical protein